MLENKNTPLELTNDPSGNLAFALGEHHFTIEAEAEGYRYTLYNQSYEKVEQDFNDQRDKTYGQVLEELLSMTKEHPIFENLEGLKQVDYSAFTEMLAPPEQLAYQLDGGYFAIFASSEGYDYSFYDASYNQLDGGVYDDPTVTIYEALEEIAQDDLTALSAQLGNYKDLPTVDFEDLTEKAEAVEMAQINQRKATLPPMDEKAQFRGWVAEYQGLMSGLKGGDMIDYLNVEYRLKYLHQKIQSSPMFEELKQNMPDRDIITENSDHIKVDGHMGTWYVADTEQIDGKQYFLLEHEEYGDEAACIIVDGKGKLVLDDAWNGFDDLTYYFENVLNEYPPPDSVSAKEMAQYGYTASELYPLSRKRAEELFAQDLPIYALYNDNTEAMLTEPEELTKHQGYFGIEKVDWNALQDLNASISRPISAEPTPPKEKQSVLERLQAKVPNEPREPANPSKKLDMER